MSELAASAPMTAAEAHAAAAEEGLALVRAENASGFKDVSRNNNASKPFQANPCHGGCYKYLGQFATAEEAALAVARVLGPAGVAAALAPPEPAPAPEPAMTAAEAHAAAASEGLTLLRAENATGFKGVSRDPKSVSKPFKAQLTRGRKQKYMGNFVTAEEAALAVARFLGPEGVAAALVPAAPEPAPMTAAEAQAAAATEGLALVRAENGTGFKNVSLSSNVSKPFKAQLHHGGRRDHLGCFATAEEAALAVARFLGPEGVAAALAAKAAKALKPAPMTAAEALVAAAAEGLSLLRADNATGFKGVSRNNAGGKPFKANLYDGGRDKHLGCFATAEEAALAVARFLGPEGVAAALVPPVPEPTPMTAAEAHAAAAAEGLTLLRAKNTTGFKGVSQVIAVRKPFKASMRRGGHDNNLGVFATAEEAALAVARFLGLEGAAAPPRRGRPRKRPAATGAGPSAPPSKRGKQPAAADDEEEYVVKAEAVSDDDDDPPPPAPAPPVLCYCERPAALLDGRWVCAQLVEGDFCILGRENE